MQSKAIKLAPSILAADFARLGEQVREAEQAGVDRIPIDVMDGHFVPNHSMGPAIDKSPRRVTNLPLETHLMISNPDSDSLLVHWEGNNDLHRTLERVKALGKRVGVAINPTTPALVVEEILVFNVDQVLVMTVDPGFGHQHFIRTLLPKIRRVREIIDKIKPGCDLEVDGGINAETNAETAPLVMEAGADVPDAGSAIFGESNGVAASIARLHAATKQPEKVAAK